MNKGDCFFMGAIVGMMVMFIALGITVSVTTIPPMAVYQGKTTLKYEVVDDVKVDSIVVWKEDFKKQIDYDIFKKNN